MSTGLRLAFLLACDITTTNERAIVSADILLMLKIEEPVSQH